MEPIAICRSLSLIGAGLAAGFAMCLGLVVATIPLSPLLGMALAFGGCGLMIRRHRVFGVSLAVGAVTYAGLIAFLFSVAGPGPDF